MTLDELNKVVRDTVVVITSLSNVIKYYPNAPRPQGSYATVNIAELSKIGNIDKKESTNVDDLDELIIMQYEAMVSVNFYKANAMQNAGIVAAALNRTSVLSDWNSNRIGLTRTAQIRDLTTLLDADQEERAQVDIFIHFELTSAPEIVTGIDTARIKGNVDNGSIVVDNVDLTIP